MAFQPRDMLQSSELELFSKKLMIVIAAALLLAILFAARGILILIFIAAVLAAGISPAVHRVRVWGRHLFHKNVPRGTAVLIVYLPFLCIAIALLVFMVPRLILDMRSLSAQLPLLLEKNILTPLEHYLPMGGVRDFFRSGIAFPRARVVLYVRSAATAIASFIAVLFMVGYMLIDA